MSALASAWEVAIKISLGKILLLAAPFGAAVEASGFAFLPLTLEHIPIAWN